jgi:hypothetical protein
MSQRSYDPLTTTNFLELIMAMEMSAGSIEAAHVRFAEIGDGWIASH